MPTKTKPKSAPKLSEGVKLAFSLAATEVFCDNVAAAVEDARALIASGELGGTYQGALRGTLKPAQAAARCAELGAWLEPALVSRAVGKIRDESAIDFACDLLDEVAIAAAADLAEAVLWVAIGEERKASARAMVYAETIRPLAKRLAQKIADEDDDEDEEIGEQFC